MKKKIIISFVCLVVVIFSFFIYSFINNKLFNIKNDSLELFKNKNSISNNFSKDYSLSYSISTASSKEEIEVINAAKKAIALLFGNVNNVNESSEEYYKRRQEWYEFRYDPEIPKDPNNPEKFDDKSEEYGDNLVSGLAIPQMLSNMTELGILYNSIDDIRVTISDSQNLAVAIVYLSDTRVRVESDDNPMEYQYEEIDFAFYFYFKKLNDEWKVYYLFGERADDVDGYLNDVSSASKMIAPVYESNLSKVYDFSKLNKVSDEAINNIYNTNYKSIVSLNSYYNNEVKSSANGFFISDNLVVTTWNFLENALENSQRISIFDSNMNSLKILGIVTANPSSDIAVLLVDNSLSFVKLGDINKVSVEDVAVIITNKNGTDKLTQKGLILSTDDLVQSSIPLVKSDEGSPLFNINGEVIGMNTSKSTSSSVSIAVSSNSLKEVVDKFSSLKKDDFITISFDELKKNYYNSQKNNETEINSIPKSKWKKYKKIGNIENTIKLKLVKASYKDNIVSLRYKNNLSNFLDSISLSATFREALKSDGFLEKSCNDYKCVYENKKYQIIIRSEFDYLIVVMVKL